MYAVQRACILAHAYCKVCATEPTPLAAAVLQLHTTSSCAANGTFTASGPFLTASLRWRGRMQLACKRHCKTLKQQLQLHAHDQQCACIQTSAVLHFFQCRCIDVHSFIQSGLYMCNAACVDGSWAAAAQHSQQLKAHISAVLTYRRCDATRVLLLYQVHHLDKHTPAATP